MNDNKLKIDQISYLGGKDVIKKLMKVTNSERQQDIADVFDIPKSTIATWRQRDLTPFEIAIRTHLRTGVSLEWLLLDKGDPYPQTPTQKHITKKNESKTIFDVDCFRIEDGQLVGSGTIAFDKSLLDEVGVINAMAIKDGLKTVLINKESRQAVNGTYLVDMDGLLSLNEIQRLPGKKLAISFNGSTIQVDELDVKVVGRAAVVMERV
ncbi:phage repressor protein CI [Vibrio furnissii]|uniref:phage repressor protein CI n=1 Tax=Vibrio furnissii TaxID=29494 RepID=UPI001EE9BD62|nr:phage repressor protein CI [Vibrio furnissii]MCG6233036.1 helix-turn-helix domain-containing protein [Vibrio furnissii]MCG6258867.1 helix-turn-helix domain-containing protein [Vibrio furnissii]